MTELMEILTTKLTKASELYADLTKIENELKKLNDEERRSLPKLRGKFDEKTLNKYFEELIRAVRNPIRFKRKRALMELGIIAIENVKDEVFDDDELEKTIQILGELKSYERLFRMLSPKIPSLLVQNSISSVNLQLEGMRKYIDSLRKIEEIRSEDIKNQFLQKYINRELNIYQINEIKEKVVEIEKTLNLLIKKEEISLLDEVYKLINDIREYGKELKKKYSDLNDARESLEKYIKELEQRYEQIKNEINFWQKLYPDVYVPKTKNIDTLVIKLNELKERCKKEYNSFSILEQIYNKKLYEAIENLKEFANKLDKVNSYFPNLEITNKKDLEIVEELYNQLSWLEEIKYPNIRELFNGLTFENARDILRIVTQIREEYKRLKEDLKAYQRILGVKEERIDEYPLLKRKIDEYRDELQNKVGKGFESLIRFLKGEAENLEADEETLRNFIKTVKPFLKEVLGI